MGSLTSRPKTASAPAAPRIVYVPASEPSVPTLSDPAPDDKAIEKERAENVLRRSRSRLGTILTGFRGILSPSDLGTQRKNLLGE